MRDSECGAFRRAPLSAVLFCKILGRHTEGLFVVFSPNQCKTNFTLVESHHTLLLHSNPVSPCLGRQRVLIYIVKCEFDSYKTAIQVIISELYLLLFIQRAQCANEVYL